MWREDLTDLKVFGRAFASNQLARWLRGAYVRLTGQTGRGGGEERPLDVADSFCRCFDEYFEILGIAQDARAAFVDGKRILEYGPGDVLGVALLMYAHGAAEIHCVDRFPMQQMTPGNAEVLRAIFNRLEGGARERAEGVFRRAGDPASGFDPARISYRVDPRGVSRRTQAYDLILSRAVLEHVSDLDATFADIKSALRPDGTSIHLVDLKSHGLDRRRPLDFLSWSAADAGAVTLIQRFGSAPNLHIHLHCLVLDGVYRRTEGEPLFQEARAPTDDELKGLLDQIVARLMKMLTRTGHLVEGQGMT